MLRPALILALLAAPALAHDGVVHKNADEARAHLQQAIKPQPQDDGSTAPFPALMGDSVTSWHPEVEHVGMASSPCHL